jgi:hypothetical protein
MTWRNGYRRRPFIFVVVFLGINLKIQMDSKLDMKSVSCRRSLEMGRIVLEGRRPAVRPRANTKGRQEMNSIIFRLVLVLAAFAVVPECWAADTGGGNVFLDAKYGALLGNDGESGDVGNYGDSTTAWGADGGYLWRLDDERSLGFEIGYMHFGQVSNDTDANEFFNGNTTATAMTGGVRYEYLFGEDKATIFQAHAGLTHAKFESSYSYFPPGGPSGAGSSSSYENGLYIGLGIGRQLTQSFSVILAYNAYSTSGSHQTNLDVSWCGLVAEYQF